MLFSKSLSKSSRLVSYPFRNRLVRNTCGKLGKISGEFDKALRINRDRISNAIKGASLAHLVPILSYTINISSEEPYKYTVDLIEEIREKLMKIEKPSAEQIVDLIDILSSDWNTVTKQIPEDMLTHMIRLLERGYPVMNRWSKKRLIDAANSVMANLKDRGRIANDDNCGLEKGGEGVQKALESLVDYATRVGELSDEEYTAEYFRFFELEGYLGSERNLEIRYDREYDCVVIKEKEKNTGMTMFSLSNLDQKDQIGNISKYFENNDNIDSLVIDQSPMIDRKAFAKPDPTDQKIFEYSQYLVNEWPYLYKFEGKPELRGFYNYAIFNHELMEERKDYLFYFKFDVNNKVLDVNTTILAHFMGFGKRTDSPAIYLSSLLPEERIIEAAYKVDLEKSERLSDIYDLFNLLGGLRLFKEASKVGCDRCEGSVDTKIYYSMTDRMFRAELESDNIGVITSSIAFEAMFNLKREERAVQVCQESIFKDSLQGLLENLRQARLASLTPSKTQRANHIKKVYNNSQNYTEPLFYKKLALLENIMGTLETTICLFVDVINNHHNLLKYFEIKQQAESQILQNWNPHYMDREEDYFCGAENIVLPVKLDDTLKRNVVYEVVGDTPESKFKERVEKRINEAHEKINSEKRGNSKEKGSGRKIRVKPKEDWKL